MQISHDFELLFTNLCVSTCTCFAEGHILMNILCMLDSH